MSGVGSKWLGRRLRSALGPAAVAAGLAALCLHASAQTLRLNTEDNSILRGRVDEDEINRNLLAQSQGTRSQPQDAPAGAERTVTPVPPYEPLSPSDGTTPPTQGNASIFDDPPDAADIFVDVPIPAGRPKTALQRAEERRAALAGEADPQQTESAAERRRREEERLAGPGVDREERTGTVRVGTVDSQVDRRLDPGVERVEAIEGLERRVEENPYDAVGIQVGTFILRPSIEQGVTVTDNVDYSPNGRDAVLSETTLRLNAISEHGGDLTAFNGYGIYRKSVSGQDYEYEEGGFDGRIERLIGDGYKAEGTVSYAIRPESFSSPVEITEAASQPIQQTLTASAGVSKDVGKLRLGVTGDVEREWYGDADLADGSTISQKDRNSTLATVTLRGGYEISPAITPFVEVTAGRRFYDLERDAADFERSANHLAASAGAEIDFGEKLSGEFSAGYVMEDLDDERLGTIGGLNMAATLNWSPQRGTVVGLTGSTEVEGTTTPGSSGSLLYAGRLTVERQIRANLTANAGVGLSYRDYQSTGDDDVIFSAEAGATWWLNRYAGLTGRVRHESLKSTLPNRDTRTNSVFLGLRLQR